MNPNPVHFQQASMLMLSFRFKDSRKVVASRLMATTDFEAELEAHLPVLDKLYSEHEVSKVEIISYQRGGFFYDEWKEGLERVHAHYAATREDWSQTSASEASASSGDVGTAS